MSYDTETLQAIIHEGRKQGFDNAFIADKLGICTEEVAAYAEGESTEPTNSRSLGYKLDNGIGEGFHEWELFHLQENDKRKILIIIARTAEATYRRGIQHGNWAASTNQKFKIHPDNLRFGTEPLDSARMPLCGTRMSSLKRLSIQHGSALAALGFDSIHDDIQ